MSTFICEKCGCIDNSALDNNYWTAYCNKLRLSKDEEVEKSYDDEYFDTHVCCSECCAGVKFYDGSGVLSKGWHGKFEKEHWSVCGTKEEILAMEARHDGSLVNATEFFENEDSNE